MKYLAEDGTVFKSIDKCIAYEAKAIGPTHYAKAIAKFCPGDVIDAAYDYAKWLRKKQDYPATDSGEHKCCDLLEELAKRLAA
jgi:hypothetical protein